MATVSNAALAARLNLLHPAGRAGGAARKAHFRVRHFGGSFVFTAEFSSFYREPRAERRVLHMLSSRLVFAYADADLLYSA